MAEPEPGRYATYPQEIQEAVLGNPASGDGDGQDLETGGEGWYVPTFDPEQSGAITVGVDIIEIERIAKMIEQHGDRFLRRIYTPRERERYESRVPELAARFAAKEATSKALGTGIRGLTWREMEVLSNRRGKPILVLHGDAAKRAAHLRLTHFDVSLTHSRTDAMAFVVALRGEPARPPVDQDSE